MKGFEGGSKGSLTRVKAFGYGGGFPEELVAEWASHACRNRFPPHLHHLIRHLHR